MNSQEKVSDLDSARQYDKLNFSLQTILEHFSNQHKISHLSAGPSINHCQKDGGNSYLGLADVKETRTQT